jgi:hypothetical protein
MSAIRHLVRLLGMDSRSNSALADEVTILTSFNFKDLVLFHNTFLALRSQDAGVYPSSLIVLEDVSYSALSSPSWYGLTLQNVPARDLVLFHNTFLALRSQDAGHPIGEILDHELAHERERNVLWNSTRSLKLKYVSVVTSSAKAEFRWALLTFQCAFAKSPTGQVLVTTTACHLIY